jgi:phosphodiester glycosidase
VRTSVRPRHTPASAARPLPPSRRRRSRPRRVRRVIALAALLSVLPAVVSYLLIVLQPSDTSLAIRSVEWLRDNGARGLVNKIESTYYSLNAPSTGGPGLRALPRQAGAETGGTAARSRVTLAPAYRPAPIAPVLRPALPGEGVWRATFSSGVTRPPVLVTSYRPDPNYPQMVAGVAWIDSTATSTQLYPGRAEPAVSMPSRGPMEVPASTRSRLVATFNSAFKLSDSGGGFASNGHTYAPMRNGMATIVRYRDGRVDIIAWTGDPTAGPDVAYARQNLPLIVSGGQLNSNLSDGPEWGLTLGNAVRVWRSGLGVDARGNLIYAVANDQTVGSLAAILQHAGAIRAIELDINTYWPSFITYRAPGAVGAANLLPGMDRSPQRYLTPDDRDFFAVYLR